MKNKSAVLSALGFMLFMAVAAQAAPGVRGAKGFTSIFGGSALVGISTSTAFSTTPRPAVVYSVIIGTGAVTDFVVLFDTPTAFGLSAPLQTNGFVLRLYATSATANTQVTFDPPLQFKNGLVAANSTGVASSVIVFERGRQPTGY